MNIDTTDVLGHSCSPSQDNLGALLCERETILDYI
jgi:hypothetical protein